MRVSINRALKELRPRLVMINYQDTDYVHWGNPNFYTRAVSIIDDGVRELWQACQADEQYRENTIVNNVPLTVPTTAYRAGNFASALTGKTLGTAPDGTPILEGSKTSKTISGQRRDAAATTRSAS